MLWDENCWYVSAKKEKINDQRKNEDEKDQIAIIACHAAEKILMKQRSLNMIETKDEDFNADNAANEEVDKIIADDEAIKEIKVKENKFDVAIVMNETAKWKSYNSFNIS